MVPLFKPYMPTDLEEVVTVLKSGQLAAGKEAAQFEGALGEYIGTHQLLTTNSFTSAIVVALKALGINAGSEILASPMGCLASIQPLAFAGCKIKWVDIDPLTGTMDPDCVEEAISSKTKAIFHNHFCGYPGHIDEINKIAERFGIPVIDDGIEAFGSIYKGNRVGNCGTACTVFSFSAVRLPNTIDGGCVVFDDIAAYERAILIRDLGIDRKRFRDGRGEIDPLSDVSQLGIAAKLNNVCSKIAILQMPRLEELIERQRANAEKWLEITEEMSYQPIVRPGLTSPNFWVFGLLSSEKHAAIEFFRSRGYYASGVHTDMSNYSVFGKNASELSGVAQFCERFFAIPCGWWVNINENDF